jgi:hypothetical protein
VRLVARVTEADGSGPVDPLVRRGKAFVTSKARLLIQFVSFAGIMAGVAVSLREGGMFLERSGGLGDRLLHRRRLCCPLFRGSGLRRPLFPFERWNSREKKREDFVSRLPAAAEGERCDGD